MKIFYTLGLVALIASASTAYANDNVYPLGSQSQRTHNQQEYWQGKTSNSTSVQKNSDYDFAVTPQQRLAKSNMEYFASKGNSGGSTAIAKNADYEFATSPSQRMAKNNYNYFNK